MGRGEGRGTEGRECDGSEGSGNVGEVIIPFHCPNNFYKLC